MPKVTSKDGTEIAYDRTGQGPALILIDGALATRASDAPLARLLASDFTVYSYDRRGRGDSGDTPPYSVEKEVQDIEALMEAAGSPAHLMGTSSGGALAIEAAIRLGSRVRELAVYEVPYDSSEAGVKAWREYRRKLDGLLAAGEHGEAAAFFLEFVGMPKEALAGMRASPEWPALVALAPTLAYDNAVLGETRKVPAARAATITAPTLILDGGETRKAMPFMAATAEELTRAIPAARHRTLEGQRHAVEPQALAPVLKEFFGATAAVGA